MCQSADRGAGPPRGSGYQDSLPASRRQSGLKRQRKQTRVLLVCSLQGRAPRPERLSSNSAGSGKSQAESGGAASTVALTLTGGPSSARRCQGWGAAKVGPTGPRLASRGAILSGRRRPLRSVHGLRARLGDRCVAPFPRTARPSRRLSDEHGWWAARHSQPLPPMKRPEARLHVSHRDEAVTACPRSWAQRFKA